MSSWPCPIELIRPQASFEGGIVLSRLAADRVTFSPLATVELSEIGFVATITYFSPGVERRAGVAHVRLAADPVENAVREVVG